MSQHHKKMIKIETNLLPKQEILRSAFKSSFSCSTSAITASFMLDFFLLLEKLFSMLPVPSADVPATKSLIVDVLIDVSKLLEFKEFDTELSNSFDTDFSDLTIKNRFSAIICFSNLESGESSTTN